MGRAEGSFVHPPVSYAGVPKQHHQACTLTVGKGKSFSVALELRLDVCDHEFQPKQPAWVPSEWRDWLGSPRCDHELWAQLS